MKKLLTWLSGSLVLACLSLTANAGQTSVLAPQQSDEKETSEYVLSISEESMLVLRIQTNDGTKTFIGDSQQALDLEAVVQVGETTSKKYAYKQVKSLIKKTSTYYFTNEIIISIANADNQTEMKALKETTQFYIDMALRGEIPMLAYQGFDPNYNPPPGMSIDIDLSAKTMLRKGAGQVLKKATGVLVVVDGVNAACSVPGHWQTARAAGHCKVVSAGITAVEAVDEFFGDWFDIV